MNMILARLLASYLPFAVSLAAVSAGRGAAAPSSPGVELAQPWRAAYGGEDATGGHVIALWQFRPGAELQDASGRGHALRLHGAVARPDERFGGRLECGPGWPVRDERHAAVAAQSPALTPKGAFTLELWIRPGAEFADYPEAFLMDKKYVADTDYQFVLGAADKGGQRRLIARLGFGEESDSFSSDPSRYEIGAWTHVAFAYDGAGSGRFFRDGAALGSSRKPARGAVAPGKHPLSIGDRIGSYYHGFPGAIAGARICSRALEFRPARLEPEGARCVFRRRERVAPLRFVFTNLCRAPLAGASVEFSMEGCAPRTIELKGVAAGAGVPVEYALDTGLRPDDYTLRARATVAGDPPQSTGEGYPIKIVGRAPPDRMPVVMWGVYGADRVMEELPRLKEIGFTHCLGFGADPGPILDGGKPGLPDTPEKVAAVRRMLDAALAADFGVLASLSPGHWAEGRKEFLRVDRQGKSDGRRPNVCGLFPELRRLCRDVGVSVARAYGDHPAFQGALLHTETRDGASPCFHEHDRAAYRAATGAEIPEEIGGKWGVEYGKLKGFPADRVIPDDHPILRYLRWYWKEGDGWCGLNTELHGGLKSAGRADLWTFHDPAVRVASTFGSGGAVDVLSQWTYSYPDPIRIGLPTDELLAMARGAGRPQRVMKMTQIIWYRSQTAPMRPGDETAKAPRSPWEDTDPDAAFPTIAPMHLREAFFAKIARPIRGIMFHGWESLVPTDRTGAYRYTHPQTQHELRRLVTGVIEPLGPTLLNVPDRPSDVAFLESFASEMFARRGSYGWSKGWNADAYLILQYAGLQPEVVYEEGVAGDGGLDRYKVLVLTDCDVLPAAVVGRIREFQKRGGIVIGDGRLCPAIRADVPLTVYERTRKAADDRSALVAAAGRLRGALGARYRPYSGSSNPDVIARVRSRGTGDYLFCVNDRREFGTYVGQYGLVMENGLPSDATLTLARRAGAVYDLLSGVAAPFECQGESTRIRAALGPCEGAIYLVVERPIAGVRVESPGALAPGAQATARVIVADAAGEPVRAVIPLRVEIRDPSGRDAEFSGVHAALDGVAEIPLDLATNDETGTWQIRVRELASGQTTTRYLRVAGNTTLSDKQQAAGSHN